MGRKSANRPRHLRGVVETDLGGAGVFVECDLCCVLCESKGATHKDAMAGLGCRPEELAQMRAKAHLEEMES